MEKIDILAIGVHPDDVELSASGALLRHADMGYTFGMLDLSAGEMGTRGDADTRRSEALEAARLLGARFRVQLDIPDALFTHAPEQWLKIVRVIRAAQPQIVLCNAPDDRHPDHGRAARLCSDACFYAGLKKIETRDDAGNPQQSWRPVAVYHYIQDRHLQPDFVIDIGAWFDRKMQAIMAFKSQFYDPEAPQDQPQTPISTPDFLRFMEAKARVFGRSIQAEYAEGFIVGRVPGVDNLFHLR